VQKEKIMKFAPSLDPTFWCPMLVLLKPKEEKTHMTLNNTTFFVFGNCGLLNFPWEWYIQHISTWNSKANQVFFSMVVSVG